VNQPITPLNPTREIPVNTCHQAEAAINVADANGNPVI
jgi:hypothetical protein